MPVHPDWTDQNRNNKETDMAKFVLMYHGGEVSSDEATQAAVMDA